MDTTEIDQKASELFEKLIKDVANKSMPVGEFMKYIAVRLAEGGMNEMSAGSRVAVMIAIHDLISCYCEHELGLVLLHKGQEEKSGA